MGSIVAVAVIGTLAWMQNMYTAPIGIGWKYFAMLMSLALIVPVGLIFFNLIATLNGGALRMRAPLLFAIGALVRSRSASPPRCSSRWSAPPCTSKTPPTRPPPPTSR